MLEELSELSKLFHQIDNSATALASKLEKLKQFIKKYINNEREGFT